MTMSPRRRKRISLALALVLVAALSLGAGCSRRDPKGRGAGSPPVAVAVAAAARKDVPVTLETIGTVEPTRSVAVRARIVGELTRVYFTEGQDVRQGEILFTIDPRPYEAALREAEADLARDRARADAALAEIRRYADLVDRDYVTRQQFDDVRANAGALKATVASDSAAVAAARLNVSYCAITAPIAGRTGRLLVHQGNLVRANDENPLVVINQIAPAKVSFAVPERQLSMVRRYANEGTLRVFASLPSDSARILSGDLSFIDNAVDEATGTILLKASFPNEDGALWPGQFVSVSLALSVLPGVVVVPESAVQPGQQGSLVYVIKEDMTAEMRRVTTGVHHDGEIVIESGIEPDERVVTDGQLRLTPGASVSIKSRSPDGGGTPDRKERPGGKGSDGAAGATTR